MYDIEGRELANLILLSHEWPPSFQTFIHVLRVCALKTSRQDLAIDSNYLIYFSMLHALQLLPLGYRGEILKK